VQLVFHGERDDFNKGIGSTTHKRENISDRKLAKQWKKFPFDKARDYVKRLQTGIAKAVKNGQYRLVKRLQYLLTHSFYAKMLAVQQVTSNRGRRSAGVDREK